LVTAPAFVRGSARRAAVGALAAVIALLAGACGEPGSEGRRKAAPVPATPGWSELPSLPEGAPVGAALAATDAFLLAAGGSVEPTFVNDSYLLDLATGAWERVPDAPFSDPLSSGRQAFVYGDDFIVAGPTCAGLKVRRGEYSCDESTFEVARFDPRARSWQRLTVPPELADASGAGVDGAVLVGDALIVSAIPPGGFPVVEISRWRLSLTDGSAVMEPWLWGREVQTCEAGGTRFDLENPRLRTGVTGGGDGRPTTTVLPLVLWATNLDSEVPSRVGVPLPAVTASATSPTAALVCSGPEVLLLPAEPLFVGGLPNDPITPPLALDVATRRVSLFPPMPIEFTGGGVRLAEPVVITEAAADGAMARLDRASNTWVPLPAGPDGDDTARGPDRFYAVIVPERSRLFSRVFQFVPPAPGVTAAEFPDPGLLPPPDPPPATGTPAPEPTVTTIVIPQLPPTAP